MRLVLGILLASILPHWEVECMIRFPLRSNRKDSSDESDNSRERGGERTLLNECRIRLEAAEKDLNALKVTHDKQLQTSRELHYKLGITLADEDAIAKPPPNYGRHERTKLHDKSDSDDESSDSKEVKRSNDLNGCKDRLNWVQYEKQLLEKSVHTQHEYITKLLQKIEGIKYTTELPILPADEGKTTTDNRWWHRTTKQEWNPWITNGPSAPWTRKHWRWGQETTEETWSPWITKSPITPWTTERPWSPWITKLPNKPWTTQDQRGAWRPKSPNKSWPSQERWDLRTTTDNSWKRYPWPPRKTTTDIPWTTGTTPRVLVKDCSSKQMKNPTSESGVYEIEVVWQNHPLIVYCDMETTMGGWTVIQRRVNGTVDFYRTWNEYARGFGHPAGEHYIGNDNLAALTSSRPYVLRIEMVDQKGLKRYEEYSRFVVGGAAFKYKILSLGQHSGTAGDSLSYHLGQPFSTFDADNDAVPGGNCAEHLHGAWWFKFCHESNLNGQFGSGIHWKTLTGYKQSLKSVVMMIRPMSGGD